MIESNLKSLLMNFHYITVYVNQNYGIEIPYSNSLKVTHLHVSLAVEHIFWSFAITECIHNCSEDTIPLKAALSKFELPCAFLGKSDLYRFS